MTKLSNSLRLVTFHWRKQAEGEKIIGKQAEGKTLKPLTKYKKVTRKVAPVQRARAKIGK